MQRVKLGDIEFTVVEVENVKDSTTITDNPVESGQDVSDHVKQNPSYINIRGEMIGENAAANLQKLKKHQDSGAILKYIGRNAYSNMVIEDIDRVHGVKNRVGFSFDIKLKQVRIATAKEVQIKVANPVTKKVDKKVATKVKPITNNGLQQPKTTTQINMLKERDRARRQELSTTTRVSSSGRIHGGISGKMNDTVNMYKGTSSSGKF